MSRHINLAQLETIRRTATAGTPVKLSPYLVSSTIAFVRGSGATQDTITDSASKFLVNGFRAGDKLVITGSLSNNIEVEISTVTAGTITLITTGTLTDEVAGSSFTLDTVRGYPISDGVKVVLKSLNTNAGVVYLAKSSARALSTATDYLSFLTLLPNEAIEVEVRNLNQIWFNVATTGDVLQVIFEQ